MCQDANRRGSKKALLDPATVLLRARHARSASPRRTRDGLGRRGAGRRLRAAPSGAGLAAHRHQGAQQQSTAWCDVSTAWYIFKGLAPEFVALAMRQNVLFISRNRLTTLNCVTDAAMAP